MTRHELAWYLLALPDTQVPLRQIPIALMPVGDCSRCKGPRPRSHGRELCWYCQHPKRRTGKRPDPYSRPPTVKR